MIYLVKVQKIVFSMFSKGTAEREFHMDYFEKRFNFVYPTELNMYYCGKRDRSENHSYGPAIRDHFLLVYIQEGEAILTCKGKPCLMLPGHILFMFPGEKIYYKVKEEFKWTILWIGVYGKLVYDFIAPLKITPSTPLFRCPDPQLTQEILEQILIASSDDSLSGKLHSLSLVYSFFASLTKDVALKEKNSANHPLLPGNDAHDIIYSSSNTTIREAENFIRFHYDSPITVKDVANSINLEQCYFTKLFKKETGITPKQKIIEYRINKACMLLKNTSLSISEISHCVGIDDPQYFARLFKKNTNLSPLAFRQKEEETSSSSTDT